LQQRGLHGTELIISDAHAGLKEARKAIFLGVAWQRCRFHLQQEAQRLLQLTVTKYQQGALPLSQWMEVHFPERGECLSFSR
jgi:transposase-like protein